MESPRFNRAEAERSFILHLERCPLFHIKMGQNWLYQKAAEPFPSLRDTEEPSTTKYHFVHWHLMLETYPHPSDIL